MPRLRNGLLALAIWLPAVPAVAEGFTEAQRAEIVDILRRALREDPSILREAISGLQAAETRARAEAQRGAILRNADALFRDAVAPVRGNPRGDVTIVEFWDARCTYCKQLHPALEALLRRDPNIRVVMKDLPVLGPTSVLAAHALLAAQRQGRYAQLQDALLSLRTELTEATLRQQVERVGLEWAKLRRDMDDASLSSRIEGNLRLAEDLGIEGTPALVIGAEPGNATLVPGAVDLPTLERLVAEARAPR